MPFGRRWFARGGGWGRRIGRGNLYPFCRNFPWVPRRWWAMPDASRYATIRPYAGLAYPHSRYHGYRGQYGYLWW